LTVQTRSLFPSHVKSYTGECEDFERLNHLPEQLLIDIQKQEGKNADQKKKILLGFLSSNDQLREGMAASP